MAWRKTNTDIETYKKQLKQSYYDNEYDLDKVVEEMFDIRQELFRMRHRLNYYG